MSRRALTIYPNSRRWLREGDRPNLVDVALATQWGDFKAAIGA